jgi:carbonic anhydrase
MSLVKPAAAQLGPRGNCTVDEYLSQLERSSTISTLENLRTFPFVQKHLAREELELHAAYFDVATGLLSIFDHASGVFSPVDGIKAKCGCAI